MTRSGPSFVLSLSKDIPARRLTLLALLALAAALAALPAAEPAHAQAQYTYWSATLTVDIDDIARGCDNYESNHDNCSSEAVLSDDEFEYEGSTYTIATLYWGTATNRLILAFEEHSPIEANKSLDSFTLHVDGDSFAFPSPETGASSIEWDFDPDPDWTDGQKVRLRLTSTVAPPPANEQKLLLSATLTVDEENGFYGLLQRKRSRLANCTKKHALSNPKFKFKGDDYKVIAITWHSSGSFTWFFQWPDRR